MKGEYFNFYFLEFKLSCDEFYFQICYFFIKVLKILLKINYSVE